MSFSDDVRRFAVKVDGLTQAVFVNSVSGAHASIVEGSPVTGAPGQPIDTGNLRNSWQIEFEGKDSAIVATNVDYAPYVENGVVLARSGQVTGNTQQRLVFKNHGPYSVKQTIAGMDKIVEDEARNLGATP